MLLLQCLVAAKATVVLPYLQFLEASPATLLQSLLPLVTSSNEEAATEAARAISNIARGSLAAQQELLHHKHSIVADSMYVELSAGSSSGGASSHTCDAGGRESVGPYVLQALVLLLGHNSWEVVGSAAGALVNLSAVRGSAVALEKVSRCNGAPVAVFREALSGGSSCTLIPA